MAVSLSEAETIRRILHIRTRNTTASGIGLAGNKTELALRYSPMSTPGAPLAGDGGVVFDATPSWTQNGTGATTYEAALAHSAYRFFDGDVHFAQAALNILIRVLNGSMKDRERFLWPLPAHHSSLFSLITSLFALHSSLFTHHSYHFSHHSSLITLLGFSWLLPECVVECRGTGVTLL